MLSGPQVMSCVCGPNPTQTLRESRHGTCMLASALPYSSVKLHYHYTSYTLLAARLIVSNHRSDTLYYISSLDVEVVHTKVTVDL